MQARSSRLGNQRATPKGPVAQPDLHNQREEPGCGAPGSTQHTAGQGTGTAAWRTLLGRLTPRLITPDSRDAFYTSPFSLSVLLWFTNLSDYVLWCSRFKEKSLDLAPCSRSMASIPVPLDCNLYFSKPPIHTFDYVRFRIKLSGLLLKKKKSHLFLVI